MRPSSASCPSSALGFARPTASVFRRYQPISRLVLGASFVLAGACSDARRPVADPEADFRALLAREWALVRLGSSEIPPPPPGAPLDSPGRDLVPGRRPTIRFSANPPGAGGRSFCNGYGSPYELRGDSLRLTRIESSAVGCDGPDSLETRFFRALWGTRHFELDSAATQLVLVAEDGTRLTFVPVKPGVRSQDSGIRGCQGRGCRGEPARASPHTYALTPPDP